MVTLFRVIRLNILSALHNFQGFISITTSSMVTATITRVEMKDKIHKEYLRRTRQLLETKLTSRNLIEGTNAWTVLLVRYSVPFLKWTRDPIYPTPLLGQDMTQGQFLKRSLAGLSSEFSFS